MCLVGQIMCFVASKYGVGVSLPGRLVGLTVPRSTALSRVICSACRTSCLKVRGRNGNTRTEVRSLR